MQDCHWVKFQDSCSRLGWWLYIRKTCRWSSRTWCGGGGTGGDEEQYLFGGFLYEPVLMGEEHGQWGLRVCAVLGSVGVYHHVWGLHGEGGGALLDHGGMWAMVWWTLLWWRCSLFMRNAGGGGGGMSGEFDDLGGCWRGASCTRIKRWWRGLGGSSCMRTTWEGRWCSVRSWGGCEELGRVGADHSVQELDGDGDGVLQGHGGEDHHVRGLHGEGGGDLLGPGSMLIVVEMV